jgi:cobalamin biosynthesis protein CobD/CbiB
MQLCLAALHEIPLGEPGRRHPTNNVGNFVAARERKLGRNLLQSGQMSVVGLIAGDLS